MAPGQTMAMLMMPRSLARSLAAGSTCVISAWSTAM
jgi:hypothetical protein